MIKRTLILICAGLLAAPGLRAQTATPAAPAPEPAPAASQTNAPATATNLPATVVIEKQVTPPKDARNIRFQFDGIPYSDVVERFAQMAGKPLLADTNLSGTLTYNDSNSYNYFEALDTLNLILAMKGTMLVEDGNNLRLVPFKQLPSMPLRIMRGTSNTGDIRPGEVVTVVLEINNLDSKEVGESVLPMLSPAGSVAPLAKGRGLIVTDRLANIQRIRTLLATIAIEQPADRSMKTYNLTHASGSIIADLLNRTFGIATAPKRTTYNPTTKVMEVLPADPNDYITAVYDEASRTLVLFGPPERITLAEELINKFEQKDGVGGDVRIYYPQSLKAEELASMIRQAIPGVAQPNDTSPASATKARIIADATQNRIIVAAPIPSQLDQIEQLVMRVDKGAIGGSGAHDAQTPVRSQSIELTKIFRPHATEATNVATIVRQALTRRSPSGQNLTTASVTYDPGSQSVVVTGSPRDVQTASDIVSQLDTGSTQPMPLVTKFVDVGSPEEAKRILPLLEQLYRNQTSDSTSGGLPHAKMMADPEAGRLIITASEEHQARLAELVLQLRSDRTQNITRHLHVVALKNSRTDTAFTSIQSLVNERMADRRFVNLPKPSLVPDAPNNRLLVTATDDQFKEIEDVVKVVDIVPAQNERQMAVVPLTAKTAAEIIPLVTQLVNQLATPGELAPSLMADPTGKQIIVLASPKDQQRVRTLIQQFDISAATAAPREFRGIELFSRTATEFTPLVQQLYLEQNRGQPEPAGGPATLLPETKNNRIMISGSEKEIARVEAIIRQLDPAGKSMAKNETRVVRLKTASAGELATLVEKSLNARSQQVQVLTDARSNSLVVTGDPAAVEAAAQMIQQLDTKGDTGPREMRLLELKSADSTTVSTLATSLFTDLMKDQRGPEYVSTTKIVADPTANRLIVTGIHDEIEQIAALVRKLDNAPEQAAGARVFKLNMSEATIMGPIVSNAMLRFDSRGKPVPRVTVTIDEKSNSLIVAGPRTDLQDVESVIERLDGEASHKERELKVFEVKGDADALATLVQKVFSSQNPGRNPSSLPTITADPASKRLFVLASLNMMNQVESIINMLDEKPEQGLRELHTVNLVNSTAVEILSKVKQIYDEQAKGKSIKAAIIYTDSSGTRLLVQGTTEQAAAIQQIVDTLESQNHPARESKVFDLGKLSEAQRVLPLVQQLYKDQLASSPQLGPADAQLLSDSKTGRILVSARADQFKILDEVFSRLGINTNQPARETRSFEIGTAADVQRILPLTQQIYQDQCRDKQDLDPADAQFIADPKGGRIIVSGKPEHLKKIEAILQQLGTGKSHADSRGTKIIDVTTASAVDLATTVRTLYLEEAKGRLGTQPPDTLITPDTGGNRLIVVGETNEIAAVEELVQKLDKVSAQSASARVFKIKSADPDKVAEIVTTSLMHYDAYGRPQKRANVSVDAKTRTIIVTGDPKELQGVSTIIEQLDKSLGEQPERKMKVITLKQGRVTNLSAQARQLYNDRIKTHPDLGTSDILMLDEAYGNQLILAGNDAQLEMMSKIIEELQAAQIARSSRETKIIEGGTTEEMTRVLPLLQQLYRERMRGRDASDPADAQIIPDEKNARFIVSGRTNHIAEIESILSQLRSGTSATQPRDTRVYELTTATASELSATVRTLYQEQAKTRPGSGALDTLILPDTAANRIIVTGATNELVIVEDIIKKLDKVGAQSASTRVFKLKSADPDKVVEILGTSLVRYDAYGRAQKRVSVVTDAKTRTIIASGDPKELQSAAVIIEQLDATLGDQPNRTMKVVPVKDRSVSDLTAKVRQIYADRAHQDPSLGTTEPLIMDDSISNQIILAGTDKQLGAIEEIMDTLQKSGTPGDRQVKSFTLERTSAASLVAMLSQVYARQVSSRETSERLVVSVGGNDRSLVVDAPAAMLTRVEELVKSLDQPGPEGANIIETVKLANSRAEEMAESVNRAITNRSAGALSRRVNVTPVPGSNSLLINGPTNAVQDVMKIIHELDQEGTGPGDIEIRVYKLENGAAKEVATILEKLLQNATRNLASSNPEVSPRRSREVSVTVDDRSNTLIISATRAHFKIVEKILPTLDKSPERSNRDVQFVWLRKAKAFEVATQLEALFEDRPRSERPVIEPDFQGNSLTIIAKRGDIAQIQDLVGRLDEHGKSSAMHVRVRPLDHVAAEKMAQMLKSIYPQVSGTPVNVSEKIAPANTNDLASIATNTTQEVAIAVDKIANALILSGPAQELDNIDRLISDLSSNFYGNESEFRLFSIQDADPVVVARTLTELIKQEAVIAPRPGEPVQRVPVQQHITVVADARTRSIIVRARPTDFALMESLIKQLDKAGQMAQLEFRIVPLTNAPPQRVLPMVQQMVTQMNTTRPGESITVALDSLSRGLLVIAREVTGAQVEKMIRSLDKPAEFAEAETKIISLKKANASQLALILHNLLKPDSRGDASVSARDLQEQISRLKITSDGTNTVLLDLNKPIKIEADSPTGTGGGNRLLITSTPDNLKALSEVVDLMDSVPVLEGVDVRFIKLQHAEATSVSQTLTTIFTQGKALAMGPGGPGAEPAGEGKALVGTLNVAMNARGNTIIISGHQESLDLAMKIIRDMDNEVGGFVTDVKLFRLKHASAIRLLPMLQTVFTEGPPVGGAEGLAAQVSRLRVIKEGREPSANETPKVRPALTIQADDQSNILIVAARTDNMELISDVIDQLDIPSASGLETVRIYPLQHADPAAIQKVLTDLYNGPRAATLRTEDKPIISLDARSSSLIVAGNTKSFAIIESLLKSLDQKLPFDLRDIAIIPLEHADANTVAPTLQKLMDARVTQRASLNQGQADLLKVIIIADQRSNALLVGGSREGFELAQNLAKQLDQAAPALSSRIRLIPLKEADARVIAQTVTTLFDQRYSALRVTDAQRTKPIILADPRSNSLLVAASQDDNTTLDDLLKRLDARQTDPALILTVLPLKHNDSARVATTIEGIFAARLKALTIPGQVPLAADQIKLEPDALNNALVVSASKENLEMIKGLLEKLDQQPEMADGVFETFTLEFADAQRVATILKSLVDQGLYRPGMPATATRRTATGRDVLSVSVDPRSNTLIVSASPENLSIVREVVHRIDNKDLAGTADVHLYQLKKARASTLAATLQQFFQAKQAADTVALNASTKLLPASVIADDRMNTLLVTGGKETFALVDRILPQMDGDSTYSQLNFRVFPLKRATAVKLQGTLQPIFANRPPRVRGQPLDPVTVIADQWVNALLVGASTEDMSTVESLVERLDSEPSDKGLAIHVFPLAKADAKQVATTVQGLFRENLPNQVVPISITADERINALVVSCGEADAEHIAELAKKLDTEQVSKVSEIRIFPLKFARADSLSSILNTALNTKPPALNSQSPNAQSLLQYVTRTEDGKQLVTAALKEAVLITPDPRMNALIVSGPLDYMGLLDQIIHRMDASSPQLAKIKVFALQNADARQLGLVLTQLFRMTQTVSAGAQRSIQYTLVRKGPDGSEEPTGPDASATLGSDEQTALSITIDPRTNSLLVGGTDHYVALVENIIESLDANSARERKSDVIRLKNTQAQDVAAAIRGFLDQERQKAIQGLSADAAASTARLFDQEEIAVVAEPTSNALLVSANQHYYPQVLKMIEDIDKPQPQVLIQVLLAEVTLDDQTDLGVEWSVTGKDGGKTYSMGTQMGVANDLTKLGGFSGMLTGSDLNFLIRALRTDGKLQVLSRPQIVTADNKPASVNIGQRVPLVDQSRLDVQNNLTTSYTYQDVGVNLTVTPKISLDGFVKMEVSMTNSDISTTSIQINSSSKVPVIDQRRATTTVSAQSGQTIVIGGLISTSDNKFVKKVPWLGDIPYMGALFRSTSVTRQRKELLILLTPQVLANVQTPVPLLDPAETTRKVLIESGFHSEAGDDYLKQRLLSPIFGTNAPGTNLPPVLVPKQDQK